MRTNTKTYIAALITMVGLVSLSPACGGDKGETGTVNETGVQTDSSSDSSIDTEDTGEIAPAIFSVAIYPESIRVDTSASWQVRSIVRELEADTIIESPSITYSSSDETVITVNSLGVVNAVGVGEASLFADYDGVIAESAVTVQDNGAIWVRVIESSTGAPVSDARVMVDGVKHLVDSNGEVEFAVTVGEAVDVTAYTDSSSDLILATVMGVIGRDLVIPLREGIADDRGEAVLGGPVNLSDTIPSGNDEKGEGLVTIGVALPTLQDGPLFFNAEHLLADTHVVDVYGLGVSIPTNLYIEHVLEEWSVKADNGPVGVWTLAGPVPFVDLFGGFSTTADLLDFMLPHIDGFMYTLEDGLEGNELAPVAQELRPNLPMNLTIEVVMPPFPEGFSGAENAMLMALDGNEGEGLAVVGLGQGKLSAFMGRINGEAYGWEGEGSVLAYAEVGGVGSGGGRVLAVADVVGGVAEISGWQSPPELLSFNHQDMSFSLSTDPLVQAARLHIRSGNGSRRDVYFPPGAITSTLPTDGPDLGYGNTVWDLISIATDTGSWDSMLRDGGLSGWRLEESATSTGRVERGFSF